jgi:hypothetical protein
MPRHRQPDHGGGDEYRGCGIILLTTVTQRARFLFLSNSRLSVRVPRDCGKHEKQQVGGFLIRRWHEENKTYKRDGGFSFR